MSAPSKPPSYGQGFSSYLSNQSAKSLLHNNYDYNNAYSNHSNKGGNVTALPANNNDLLSIINGTYQPAAPAATLYNNNVKGKSSVSCIINNCRLKYNSNNPAHLCESHQLTLDHTGIGKCSLVVQLEIKWEYSQQTFGTIIVPIDTDLTLISQEISRLPEMMTFRWKILFNAMAVDPTQYPQFTARFFLPYIYIRRFNKDGTINTMRASADTPVQLLQPQYDKLIPGVGNLGINPQVEGVSSAANNNTVNVHNNTNNTNSNPHNSSNHLYSANATYSVTNVNSSNPFHAAVNNHNSYPANNHHSTRSNVNLNNSPLAYSNKPSSLTPQQLQASLLMNNSTTH
jgi:hypothetical protein